MLPIRILNFMWGALMANKYNPQIKIEMFKLSPEGEELPMDVEIIPPDIQRYQGYKPILVECQISKELGAAQDTAVITLHNAPIIEEIRSNYFAYLQKIRDQNWRIKIWAWWSDSPDKTEPEYSPIFIGDIYDDVNVQSSSVNDSSMTLRANSHEFIMRSGKYRTEFPPETTRREIVDDVFEYFGTLGYDKKIVIQDKNGILDEGIEKRRYVINRNPTEVLNDICRHHDFVWGVDSGTLYMLHRKEVFLKEQLPLIVKEKDFTATVYTTGMTSLVNFSKYQFSFSNLWDNAFSLGKIVAVAELPQINIFQEIPIAGRINRMDIQLSNYQGHSCNLTCQYYDFEGSEEVILPPQRQDFSGRSL